MRIKTTKALLAALSAIIILSVCSILLSSCSKGDKLLIEPPPATAEVTAPTEPTSEPTAEATTPFTEPTTVPSTEPSSELTTEPTTQSVTTKPTEKTTAKTTQKTTAKTTAEDVPLPEPEAIAERPEKLSPGLREWVASAQPDELIEVYLWRESLPDDEIDALVLAEYGLEPDEQDGDDLVVVGPAEEETSPEERQQEAEYINALIAARRAILKREYTRLNDEFIASYIPKERKITYAGWYSSTITVKATAGEILFYSSLPQVLEISSDFALSEPESYVDVSEPEPSIEVGEPEPAVEVGEPETSDEEE